jgi:LytR cell envelope-related transcriptional attenuator
MMAAPPYALSVHHFVSQVGDYVGFAAIVAVAIMILLLFAHARETAELRRRAEFAEDELALLHEQVEWLHDAQQPGGVSPGAVTPVGGAAGASRMPGTVVAPPASATDGGGGRSAGVGAGAVAGAAALAASAGTSSATSAGTVAPVPAPASAARRRSVVFGAPVGVGAPALSSATKLIPPTDEELRAVAAAAAEPAAHAESANTATEAGAGAGRQGAVAAPPAPPPATAAGAGGNGKPPRRAGIAADPAASGGGRPGYPAAVTSPRRNYGSGEERSGRRRVRPALIAAMALLVAAIVVVAVLVLDGGSSNKNNSQAAANQTSTAQAKVKAKNAAKTKAKGATVKINPQTVTVAVLNGTTTANLAAAVSDKLSNQGFQQGATGNAAIQTMASTIVGYLPGDQGAKNDAYAVAVALGLKPAAVKPVSTASQSVACSGTPTNCPDQVIVTVGADLNSDAA